MLSRDLPVDEVVDRASVLLAGDNVPAYDRGVFELVCHLTGLNGPADRTYLAVRLSLDLDQLYPDGMGEGDYTEGQESPAVSLAARPLPSHTT